MLIARRKFLRAGLVFGASAVLLKGNVRLGFARSLSDDGPLSIEVLNDPIYRFTRETFEPYVGGYFEVLGARGEMVALKLLKVDSYSPDPNTKITTRSAAETDSFSLLFGAEGALPRFPSIYEIKHGALGDFSLFLTRRDNAAGEIFYEAVFNHTK
jgi:hypothetical protein